MVWVGGASKGHPLFIDMLSKLLLLYMFFPYEHWKVEKPRLTLMLFPVVVFFINLGSSPQQTAAGRLVVNVFPRRKTFNDVS